MTQNRSTRATENREETSRRKPWAPPSRLEAPQPPEGYVHRWIRTGLQGEDDKTNVHTRLREGWEPVRADEHPEFNGPSIDEGKHAGIIGQGGLMLVRMPAETVAERNAYYGDRSRAQMKAVDQDFLKEEHPSMPLHSDRKSNVTFGGGKTSE